MRCVKNVSKVGICLCLYNAQAGESPRGFFSTLASRVLPPGLRHGEVACVRSNKTKSIRAEHLISLLDLLQHTIFTAGTTYQEWLLMMSESSRGFSAPLDYCCIYSTDPCRVG